MDTKANPPRTTWIHPSGPAPAPLPAYSPPAGPPNNSYSTYTGGYSPANQAGGNGSQPYGDSGGAEYLQQNVNNQKGLGRYY